MGIPNGESIGFWKQINSVTCTAEFYNFSANGFYMWFQFFHIFLHSSMTCNNNCVIKRENPKYDLRPQDQQLLTPSCIASAQHCHLTYPLDTTWSSWFLVPFKAMEMTLPNFNILSPSTILLSFSGDQWKSGHLETLSMCQALPLWRSIQMPSSSYS